MSILKKRFWGFAAMLMLLLAFALTVPASAASGSCGSGVSWKYDSSTATLTISGKGAMNNYSRSTIPWYAYKDQIKALVIEPGVTYIGTEAFYELSELKTAVIGDTVTAIGDGAFCWCEDLQAIEIPASVRSIGENAFWCCLDMTEVKFNEGLQAIADEAFTSCILLEEVEFPTTLREFGYWCFGDCSSLESVSIPGPVTAIPPSAFSGCTKLKNVELPDTLKSIGGSAFAYCYALETLDVPVGVTEMGDAALYMCTSLKNLVIPGTVHSIGDCCFGGSSALECVRFMGPAPQFSDSNSFNGGSAVALYPEGAAGWDESVLHGHGGNTAWFAYGDGGVELSGVSGDTSWQLSGGNLTVSGTGAMDNFSEVYPAPWGRLVPLIDSISISDGVSHIGDNAFKGLKYVRSVDIPASVVSIGEKAFSGSGIGTLRFLGEAPSIAGDAFENCGGAITYPAECISWTADVQLDYGGSFSWSYLSICESHSFGQWTEERAADCERAGEEKRSCGVCGFEETRFTERTGHIFGDSLVTQPGCLEYGYILASCSACGHTVASEHLSPLGHSWGGGVVSGSKTTYTCTRCGEKRYEYSISGSCGSAVRWTLDTDTGVLRIFGSGAMGGFGAYNQPWKSYVDSVRHVVIESGVTGICAEAFFECGSIETIEMADTVKSIGMQAFVWCDNMKSINLPEGITALQESTFWGCQSLEQLVLPSTLRSLGDDVFYSCESLKSIVLPEGVTSVGENLFWQCYGLEEVSVPSTLTALGNDMFSTCRSLRTVHLPDTLLSIGESAFDYCYSLENIDLPEKLRKIENYAFYQCTSLKSLSIPGSVQSIGASAFSGCSSLESIRFAGNPPTFDANTFKGAAATAFYPNGNSAWTYSVRQQYGGSMRWVPYGSSGSVASGWAGNVYWKMQGDVLVLTGSGNGKMSFSGNAPWYHLRGEIRHISIDNGVTLIYGSAFKGLYGVESVHIPASVTQINSAAFSGCVGLKEVYFKGAAPSIYSDAFSGVTAKCSYPSGYGWLSSNLKNYGGKLSWAFRIEDCTSHSYGPWETLYAAGCSSYGLQRRTCLNCEAFEDVNTSPIGHSFSTTVNAPGCTYDGFTIHSCDRCDYYYMDSYVAHSGHQWDEGSGSTTVWTYTCTACGEKRTEYTVGGSCGTGVYWRLSTETGILTIYGNGAMNNYGRTGMPWYSYKSSITSVVIESGVTAIGSYAFYEHEAVRSIELPTTVKRLGLGSFCWCESLESLTVPEGVTSIPEDCFWACLSMTELNLPSTLRTIGQGAFYSTDIKEIYLSDSITSLGEDAFWQCSYLESVVIPKGVTVVPSTCFASCTALKSVTLHDGIIKLDESAFSGCSAITSLEMPESLQILGDSSLSRIKATSLTFSPNIRNIESYAFYGSSVRELHFTGNAPEFDASAFKGLSATVYYPIGNPTWTAELRQQYGGSVVWRGEYSCRHSYSANVVEPECMAEGWTEYVCTLCGDMYTDDFTEPLGHDYSREIISPDCENEGYYLYSCARCGDSYEEFYAPAYGHYYTYGICDYCGDDAVEVSADGGEMSISCDELEHGTVLYLTVYGSDGRMTKTLRIVWEGENFAVSVPENSTWKLMFMDSEHHILRKAITG